MIKTFTKTRGSIFLIYHTTITSIVLFFYL